MLDLKDLRYFNSFSVSKDKILAVAAYEEYCYTATMDNMIQTWHSILGSHISFHTEHKTTINCLQVFRNGQSVISGDKSGRIVIFEPFTKKTIVYSRVNSEITSIALTTIEGKDYAAIGYHNGHIYIEHIDTDMVMTTSYRLSNDNNDAILALAWQYTKNNSTWPLLASSTKLHKHISVWNVPSESFYSKVNLPHGSSEVNNKTKNSMTIQLAWSPDSFNLLYYTTHLGHIVYCTVKKNQSEFSGHKLMQHHRTIFTLQWYNGGRNCITTALDKQIIKWNVKSKRPIQTVQTHSAFPYSLHIPSWDTSTVAVGLGDSTIKLWNYSNANDIMTSDEPHNYYKAKVLWKGLVGRIDMVTYHPYHEHLLAFSSDTGNVGLVDTLQGKSNVFKHYHKSQGHPIIAWGSSMATVLNDPEMTDTLISCGSKGEVYAFCADNSKKPPIDLCAVLQENNKEWMESIQMKIGYGRIYVAINRESDLIAFGHTNGLVEVFRLATLRLVYASTYHKHKITAIDWKTAGDTPWLATACHNGQIGIHEIQLTEDDVQVVPHSTVFRKYSYDNNPVRSLKWSHHEDQNLIAAGYRNSFVAIYNIQEKKAQSLFTHHREGILSICWSLLEMDMLFTSAEDRFIYHYNYKDYPCHDNVNEHPTLISTERKQYLASNKRKRDLSAAEEAVPQKKHAVTSNHKTAFLTKTLVDTENTLSKRKKQVKCLLIANKMTNKLADSIQYLLAELSEEEIKDTFIQEYSTISSNQDNDTAEKDVVDLMFGDKNDIDMLLDIEVESSDKRKKDTTSVSSAIESGLDVKLALDIIQGHYRHFQETNSPISLMDWIILALSPMAGKSTWIQLMKAQGDKLKQANQYHLSASCYVACSRIYDAIDVYRASLMYREAIVLAKLRLPVDDPIVPILYREWANQLQLKDENEMAAICYLISGDIYLAVDSLSRNSAETGLFAAACLSLMTDDSTATERVAQWKNSYRKRLIK